MIVLTGKKFMLLALIAISVGWGATKTLAHIYYQEEDLTQFYLPLVLNPAAEPVEVAPGAPIDDPLPEPGAAGTFYVSPLGSNGDGRSWGSAWTELDQIDWSALQPGSLVYLDGGSESMTYRTTLDPQKSGASGAPITLALSDEAGRNGRAIIFGGNGIPLPECGQRSWDDSQHRNAGDTGLYFDNNIEHIVVDGRKRGGIVIHGWKESGVAFNPDRIGNGQDDNPKHITLRDIEIYNNGGIERQSDGDSRDLYYPYHGDPGIQLAGSGHLFEGLEVHDNAADAIQSAFTNPGSGTYNNMDDLTITDSWFYNQRPHSGEDNSPAGETCTANDQSGCDELGAPQMGPDYHRYPADPPNRRESFNWCTHSDGIQIFSSNDFNKMTIERTIIGPNFMTGLILGDRNGGNENAWVNDLTLRDVVITRYMHNALGMKNDPNQPGERWTLERVTMYGHYNNTNKGTLNIDSNANYDEHRIVDSIMVHGRTNFPSGNIAFDGNCEHDMYSNSIGGARVDPEFRQILSGDLFEADLNVDFATVFLDDYSAQHPVCQGSSVTSVFDLQRR